MVNIHHHEPMGPVPDKQAMELFQQPWSLYQKFIDNDFGSSTSVYRTLHRVLSEHFDRPFSILHLAYGDARGSVSALKGTTVQHDHGIDLAPPSPAI